MELNERQLRLLFHTLGITSFDKRKPDPYRNYYCASRTGEDRSRLEELVTLGAMKLHYQSEDYMVFSCTKAGKTAAIKAWYKRRLPRAKRVYRLYLRISDTAYDLTFKEFLTSPEFAETRRNA